MYTSRPVTFAKPFRLPGMTAPHAPGTFEARETREALEPPLGLDLSFPWTAFRTTTMLMIPAGGGLEAWPVTGDELQALLAQDR
jgi:hypothetical protein